MKIKCLIVVQLFLTYFSFSQDKDTQKGWYAGPSISYSSIHGRYDKYHGFDNTYFNNRHFTYSVGAAAMYSFGTRHAINFGINYSETRDSYISFLNPDSISNPGKVESEYFRQTSKYLLLPLSMNFRLLKGNISPYILTGFTPVIFLEQKDFRRTTYTNGTEKETANNYSYNQLDLYWQLGIGVDVNLTKSKFRVFVYDSGASGPLLYTLLFDGFWNYSIHTGISYYLKTSHH